MSLSGSGPIWAGCYLVCHQPSGTRSPSLVRKGGPNPSSQPAQLFVPKTMRSFTAPRAASATCMPRTTIYECGSRAYRRVGSNARSRRFYSTAWDLRIVKPISPVAYEATTRIRWLASLVPWSLARCELRSASRTSRTPPRPPAVARGLVTVASEAGAAPAEAGRCRLAPHLGGAGHARSQPWTLAVARLTEPSAL